MEEGENSLSCDHFPFKTISHKINLNLSNKLMRPEESAVDISSKIACKTFTNSIKKFSVRNNLEDMIPCLEKMLEQILHETQPAIRREGPFYCRTKPSITISNYLKSKSWNKLGIAKFVYCLPVTFILALIYMDRYQNANPDFSINEYSIHR